MQRFSQPNLANDWLYGKERKASALSVAFKDVFSQQSSRQQTGGSEMNKAHYLSSGCISFR